MKTVTMVVALATALAAPHAHAHGRLADIVGKPGGQRARPSQSGYVISPRGTLDVQRWRKSLALTTRTGRPDDVGVIGLALFRKKAHEPQPIAPEEIITLYYDSHAALVARGGIRETPQAFPGFAPEPSG